MRDTELVTVGEAEAVGVMVPLGFALALEVGQYVEVRVERGVRVGGLVPRGEREEDTDPVGVMVGRVVRVAVTVRVEEEEGAALKVEVGVFVRVCVEEEEELVVGVLELVREEDVVLVAVALRVEDMEGARPTPANKARGAAPPSVSRGRGGYTRDPSWLPPRCA